MTEAELELLRQRLACAGGQWGPVDIAEALRELGLVVSDALVLHALDALRRTSVGAGPLQALIEQPGVTDVLVNGPGQVLVDRGRGLELTPVSLADEAEVRHLATRLATLAGRRLDDASPFVDARLPDGTRLHAVLAPIADPGTCISLRVPARHGMTLPEWVSNGSLPVEVADLLQRLVACRAAFLISGGTGSGKTTLLATLLSEVPPDQRIVVVEDSRELQPRHPHCVRLEARHTNSEGAGTVSLTDLVRQALRMRPDRLVVGEVRGAELCDLLTALNTGHEGGGGTIHANSATDVPARLEALAALGGMSREATQAQAVAAIDVVVHVRRWPSGRRGVSELGVLGRVRGEVTVTTALSCDPQGGLTWGPGRGHLQEVLAR